MYVDAAIAFVFVISIIAFALHFCAVFLEMPLPLSSFIRFSGYKMRVYLCVSLLASNEVAAALGAHEVPNLVREIDRCHCKS